MKKLSLILVVLLFATMSFAQKAVVRDAEANFKKGKLDKAKESIDLAIKDPVTSLEAKTWLTRANIYLDIFTTPLPMYKALSTNALDQAKEAMAKVKALDTKNELKEDAAKTNANLVSQLYNNGAALYGAKNYVDAAKAFEETYTLNKELGKTDTASMFNAGLSSELGKDETNAIKYYSLLVDLKYPQAPVYSSLAVMLINKGKFDDAKVVIAKGKAQFPDNFDMLIAETNVFLKTGQTDKALIALESALKKDTTNQTIYFAVGANYNILGNDITKPADFRAACYQKAEKAYLKALSIKPEYFDATYNLGALYVNKASSIIEEANKLPLTETVKYDKLKGDADVFLKMAIPYLEKAHKLEPKDMSSMSALKEIYTRLKMDDQLKAINADIQAAK
jgi:tetratricopeptide (TPR) repeat protein